MDKPTSNKLTTKDKITKYLEAKGLSKRDFSRRTGLSTGFLDSGKHLGTDKLKIIMDIFPDLSLNWLVFDKGDMISVNEEGGALNHNYNKPMIPLLPYDAVAGFGSGDFSIQESDIQDEYLVPDFVNIDFMIRVRGSSMYPKYNSGDVVACRIIKERAFIQWNKAHLVDTEEQGAIVKRLKKGSPGTIMAISDNPEYDPFEIPEDQIRGLALVVGVIRLE